ncbi:MAG TPA: integrase [Nitrososphaeraceae archaeon]
MLKRKGIEMHMNYCHKIFATYLRNNGIEQEIIDLLQGRIPKSVFVRHYYRPDLQRFEKIRELLDKLYEQITH